MGKLKRNTSGFTIVELLIVVVVIAILAAITIVSYNGVIRKAQQSSAKSDLANFAKIMELYKVDNNEYPATFTSAMGIRFTRDIYGGDYQGYNVRYCRNTANGRYILMVNTKSGDYFRVTDTGVVETTPSTYGWGVCDLIGIVTTNPTVNGYNTTTGWASWVN